MSSANNVPDFTVDGHTWNLVNGFFFRDRKFVAWAEVPAEVRRAAAHADIVNRDHDAAISEERSRGAAAARHVSPLIDPDYVVNAYIAGTNPRVFRVAGQYLDSGLFTVHYAEQFNWPPDLSLATLHEYINEALILAGHRIKEETSREVRGLGTGRANVPASLEAYL